MKAILKTRCGCTRTFEIPEFTQTVRLVMKPKLSALRFRKAGEEVSRESISEERLFTFVSGDPDGLIFEET